MLMLEVEPRGFLRRQSECFGSLFKTKKAVLMPRAAFFILKEIASLSSNPRSSSVRKLSGKLKDAWRVRIGDYRLLYDIDDQAKRVILLDLDHRRQISR